MIRPGALHVAQGVGIRPAFPSPVVSRLKLRGRRAAIVASPMPSPEFSSLAETLIRGANDRGLAHRITLIGSTRDHRMRLSAQHARRVARELLSSDGADSLLFLGASAGGALAGLKRLRGRRVVLAIDGPQLLHRQGDRDITARLNWMQASTVRAADEIVVDNPALSDVLFSSAGLRPKVVPLAERPLRRPASAGTSLAHLPPRYTLSITEPVAEARIHTMLRAFAGLRDLPLVIMADWSSTRYGRLCRAAWDGVRNLYLIEPERDPDRCAAIEERAWLYLHSHAAGGGTLPLAKMMQRAIPVLIRDCAYNRALTAGMAPSFGNAETLADLVRDYASKPGLCLVNGAAQGAIARRCFDPDATADAYFDLLGL